MDYMVIGEILKAQGIKGEVKVRPLTDDISRYKKLLMVYIDDIPYKILALRNDSAYIYLGLSGVTDRTAAELLRGKLIKIDRVNSVELSDDTFFISDIIGCVILDEGGVELGKIIDISQFGAADVYTAKLADNRIMRFPFLQKFIINIDTENKKFVVNKKLFDEVCVYDD